MKPTLIRKKKERSYEDLWKEFLTEDLDITSGMAMRDGSAGTKKARSPAERKEKVLPGSKEFSKLSRLLMDDENDEEEEVELLAEPPDTYKPFPYSQSQTEDKNKKPDCMKGNGNHSKKDGRFTTPKSAGSWSKSPFSGKEKDCKHGSYRANPQKWTKVPCGRMKVNGRPSASGKKAPYRCYDGKKVAEILRKLNENEIELLTQFLLSEIREINKANLITETDRNVLQKKCSSAGFYSLDFFLRLQDKLKQSQDGKLTDKK